MISEKRRPPYRWFLVGPERSGTCVHIDPLATSAWNTLIVGKKRWVLFPPHVPKSIVKGKKLIKSNEDDEAFGDIIDLSAVSEAYGTASTQQPSRATNRMQAQVAANSARRADNITMKQNRGPGATRTTAGSNKVPTGQGSNANAIGQDPDDVQRGQNADTANQASQQAQANAQEIERLKQLAMGNK